MNFLVLVGLTLGNKDPGNGCRSSEIFIRAVEVGLDNGEDHRMAG